MNKNHVVDSYTNYQEENRLTTDNARKVEFITTIKALEEKIPSKAKILDCAAGTGIYSFYFANKGHDVTALDITPRYVEIMKEKLKGHADYHMHIDVNDARDLSSYHDESFDVVLCMGPLYHLISEEERHQCLKECLRVLKKDGLLVTAYINKLFVIPYVMTNDFTYLDTQFIQQIKEKGFLKHSDSFCFWTDTYYSSPEEMENIYHTMGTKVIDHLATDGISIFLSDKINRMNNKEFEIWCDYHYSVCREKSTMGNSNHVLIIGKK